MKTKNNFPRVNGQIRAPYVKLVDENGEMKGAKPLAEALRAASELNLDLVEVSPSANRQDLPICKLLDYGKVKYEMSKKQKQNSKGSQSLKEIRVGLNTADHDLAIKHAKVLEFLEGQHKVRYTMQVKGRQRARMDLALSAFEGNLRHFSDIAKWDSPQVGGRGVSVLLVPAA